MKNGYPDRIIPEIRLSELIDFEAVTSMMESIYCITGTPMAIIDLNGNILAGAGWQDICTKFHRKHPGTLKNCIESDTRLTVDIPKGEFRFYRCKNGMCDMATPLFFEKHRIGNLFTGQFFFTDEEPDTRFFRSQASEFKFNETEYMNALRKVPRLNRSDIDKVRTFMVKLADTLAQLGNSRLKLKKALDDTKILFSNLKKSKYLLEQAEQIAHLGSWELDLGTNILTWSDEVFRIFGTTPAEFEPTYDNFLQAIHPDDRRVVSEAYSDSLKSGEDYYEVEHRIIRHDTGEIRWLQEKCRHFRDTSGEVVRSVGMVHDITERKKSEIEVRESGEKLNIALEVASIGVWEWNIQEDKFHADDRLLSMLKVTKPVMGDSFRHFKRLICHEDLPYFKQAVTTALRYGKPLETMIRARYNDEIRYLNVKGLVYNDSKKNPSRMLGVCFDVTRLKDFNIS